MTHRTEQNAERAAQEGTSRAPTRNSRLTRSQNRGAAAIPAPVRSGSSRRGRGVGSAGQTFLNTDTMGESEEEASGSVSVRARRQSSPPPPPPGPEVPSQFYRIRDHVHEHNWQEQQLRGLPYTEYGWAVIDQNRLRPLLVPQGRAYMRLTQLFYQNMRSNVGTDDSLEVETLTVKIDGWECSFTKEDLAHALGIPASASETLCRCPI